MNRKSKILSILIFTIIFVFIVLSFLVVFTSCSSDIAEVVLTISGKKDNIYIRVKNFENQIHQGGRGFASPHSITIFDRNKIILAKIYDRDFEYVSIEQIPPYLVDLLLIKEDFTFFTHKGIVPRRILVSILKNIRYKRNAFGGSTITQQVSKLLFTDQTKTISRKAKEMLTAFYLEKILTKDEILEIYLNIAFFGYGRYGVAKASEFYFNKKVEQLNFAESAMLISIISSPERFSPLKNKEITKSKISYLMSRALKVGYINEKVADYVKNDFIENYDFQKLGTNSYFNIENKAPWVRNYVLSFIEQNYGLLKAFEYDFEIYTTIDINAQFALQDSANTYISEILPQKLSNIEDENKIEISSISINPETGEILSFIGGKKLSPVNEFNRAFYSKRQVGSIFKPFLYLYAFINGIVTPMSIFEDKPLKLELENQIWEPKNYGNQYYGNVFIFDAIKKSLNSVMIQVTQKIDLNKFIDWFNENIALYIDKKTKEKIMPYLSIGLGTFEFSPLDIATMYTPIASLGNARKPYLIEKIVSHQDIIYSNIKEETYNFVEPKYIKELIWILAATSQKGGTSYTAKIQTNFNYPVYSKTGTTNNGMDSWFVGFTKGLLTVIWTGYDLNNGKTQLTGGGFSAYLYYLYIQKIYPFFAEDYNFVDESGKLVNICTDSLLIANPNCPNTVVIYLPNELIPSNNCNIHQ
ncbi:MAG: hypothetical protein GYA61_00390 [Spirochaetales bacterium]|jgi:penicillin-binding protein 1A|nr:transglycosylase domain-containing protein [Exilispira sp.]NMC66662.1 hypothetical protein [Spirochaetales bacterium]